MSRTVHHFLPFLTTTFAALTPALLLGCTEDPCVEQPDLIYCSADGDDDAETGGEPLGSQCTPFSKPDTIGTSYLCHGNGNGWLNLDIYGGGERPPECVNWGEGGKPSEPSTDDCVPVAFEMLPGGVPNPGACCVTEAGPEDIEG
ncbi:MAG: hypothetical protein KC431_26235, partial [Myxococcales bacterium]|nr:hypothetical protein [Myxococcales bacterium]